MQVTNRYLMTAADLPSGLAEKVKENIKKYDLSSRKNPNEGSPILGTEPTTNPYMTRLDISKDDANLLKSFRLEEYVELTERMKASDPAAYRLHLKNLQDAEDRGDISAKIRERNKAYTWAYGDILDILHKENPDLDVYIRSAGTPKNFEFRSGQEKQKNRPYLIISTDEIKQLQSLKDKEKKDKLWNEIRSRITQ